MTDGEGAAVQGHTGHRKVAMLFVCLFLSMHVASVLSLPKHAQAVSYVFLACAPWLAVAAAVRAGVHAAGLSRTAWLLTAGAVALWGCGMALAAWSDLVAGSSPLYANAGDFAYFIYGAPMLAALSLPGDGDEIRRGVLFDLFQAVLFGVLSYVTIFNALPFSHEGLKPASSSLIVSTYNVENIALLIVSLLRLLVRPPETDRRSFDLIVFLFLLIYAICAGTYNYLCLTITFDAGPQDALVDIPFLFLVIMGISRHRTGVTSGPQPTFVRLFIGGASPVLLTIGLLSLATLVAQRDHVFGGIAILLTLLSYAGKAALMQTHYLHMQATLRSARDRLERISLEDGLTGIANRRSFDLALAKAWRDAGRHDRRVALLLMDIDHFKRLNDVHGHITGDRCLVQVAAVMSGALKRSTDLLCRYGGEEFAILLSDSNGIEAEAIAQQVLERVRMNPMLDDLGISYPLTISVGIAVTTHGIRDASELVEAADKALYRAKRNGRDRIEKSVELA